MQYIIDRLRERSTYIGAIAFLSAMGVAIEPELTEYIVAVGTGLAGIVAAITKG